MCKKLDYCAIRIDPCVRMLVDNLNRVPFIKTLASCCGHDRYPITIVTFNEEYDRLEVAIFVGEVCKIISLNGGKKRKKFYVVDDDGFYYIPEVKDHLELVSYGERREN